MKIAWAMTNYGPIFTPVYTSHLSAAVSAARRFEVLQLGSIGSIDGTDRMYTHSAENNVVQNFLDTDATHLFMTECDMILPDDTLVKLASHDYDAVCGLYFLRGGDGQPCLYKKVVTTRENPWVHSPVSIFPTEELFPIDCPGLGCVLFKRKVFETLEHPWFDLKEGKYGSDMFFYTNFKKAGLKLMCDPTVRCDQIEYVVVGFKDYENRLKNDPKYAARGYIVPSRAINE